MDIQKSTQIQSVSRKVIIEKLLDRLSSLNKNLDPTPIRGLSFNYGDEISGLFEKPDSLYKAVSEIRNILYPVTNIRYVVVKGRIGHDSEDITHIGGEVFKKANKIMGLIKKRNRYCHWSLGQELKDAILISLSELSNKLIEKENTYKLRRFYEKTSYYSHDSDNSVSDIFNRLRQKK